MSDKSPTVVDAFLTKMQSLSAKTTTVGGRLIFALDATASRQPTWDTACQLQADMFREVATIGGLSVQLVYYRGLSECRSSRWVTQPGHLAGLMERIMCRSGETQTGKVLAHARRETELLKVQALVFVGDAMEENPDALVHDAAPLGRAGVPAFMFARQLAELLRAVAVYAAGGMVALESRTGAGAVKLLGQIRVARGSRLPVD